MIWSILSGLWDMAWKILILLFSVIIVSMFANYISYIPLVLWYWIGMFYLLFKFINLFLFPVYTRVPLAYWWIVFIFLFRLFMRFILANAND